MSLRNLFFNRYVKILLLLLVVFIAYSLINSYLLKGRVVVVVEDTKAVIYLADPKTMKTKNIGIGVASARLSPGQYIVEAKHDDKVSRMAINIKARKTTSSKIKLITPTEAAVAISDKVGDNIFSGKDGSLTFLNRPFRVIYKYVPGTDPKPYLGDIYPVSRLSWLGNGGAIASNNDGATYIDSAGVHHDLSGYLNSQIGYAVAPSGNIAYLSNKSLLLKKSPLSSTSFSIANLEIVNHKVLFSPDSKYILIVSGVLCVDIEESECLEIKARSKNIIFDSESFEKIVEIPNDLSIDSSVWGLGGELAYATGTNLHLYDLATKADSEILTTINSTPVWPLMFKDEDIFFYAQDSYLWEYDIRSNISYKISSYQGSILPSSFTLSADKHMAYFSTDADVKGAGGNIYNLSLP